MRRTMLAVASHATPVNAGDTFSESHAISALAALAQPTRLAIFRLLIKHEPIGITAGVKAEALRAPPNTPSSPPPLPLPPGSFSRSRPRLTPHFPPRARGRPLPPSFFRTALRYCLP